MNRERALPYLHLATLLLAQGTINAGAALTRRGQTLELIGRVLHQAADVWIEQPSVWRDAVVRRGKQ